MDVFQDAMDLATADRKIAKTENDVSFDCARIGLLYNIAVDRCESCGLTVLETSEQM